MPRSSPTSSFLLAALLLLPGTASAGGGEHWMADLEPALELARRENKDVLVDFTGSDWCGWCIRLDKEVFSHDEFLDYVDDKFVLVALDFPREGGEVWQAMPDDLRERNANEAQRYGIRGFPTILLLSPDGVEYGRTGYREGGPEPYSEHLDELRNEAGALVREHVATLRTGEGAARLEAGYALWEGARGALRDEILAVVRELDPDDSRNLLALAELDGIVNGELEKDEPDFAAIEAGLAGLASRRPKVEKLAQFHFTRGWVALQRSDVAGARTSAEKLAALDDADPGMVAWLQGQIDEAEGEDS